MTLAMPIPPTSKSDGAEAEEQRGEGGAGGIFRGERIGRPRRFDFLRSLRIDSRRQDTADHVDGAFLGAHVDPLGRDVVADHVRLGRVDADDRATVETFGRGDRIKMPMTANQSSPMRTRRCRRRRRRSRASRRPPNRARRPGTCLWRRRATRRRPATRSRWSAGRCRPRRR